MVNSGVVEGQSSSSGSRSIEPIKADCFMVVVVETLALAGLPRPRIKGVHMGELAGRSAGWLDG